MKLSFRTAQLLAALFISIASLEAQQANSFGAQLNVNGPINSAPSQPLYQNPVLGIGPVETSAFYGQANTIRVLGIPNMPVALVYGAYQPGALVVANTFGNTSIDIADAGGFYANQILLSGFSNGPTGFAQTNASGAFTFSPVLTCPLGSAGACATLSPVVVALQAIVGAPFNPPLLVQSTAASVISVFSSPFTMMTLPGDLSVPYTFPNGFSFNFYGTTYTDCFVSANGFVSFGAVDTGFPAPTVASVRAGVRRIMSFYDDLTPEVGIAVYSSRIYVHQFIDGGTTKLRVVHENLSEFANATGPHGGEIVMSQNGDIEIFIPQYCRIPSISTVVGITPGNNIDPFPSGTVGQTAFGRDLSADSNLGPTPLGINRIGFEVFDYSNTPLLNPIDLIGFGYTPGALYSTGIRFTRNPLVTAPGQAEYIVQ